jgi:signal peptidase I
MRLLAGSRQSQKLSLAMEVLCTTGRVQLRAQGYSMLPTLWPGDIVTIRADAFEDIQSGDIVLFHRWGRFFLHRVVRQEIGAEGTGLVTRGDAMSQCDPIVQGEEFLGRAVAARKPDATPIHLSKYPALRRALGWLMGSSDRLRSLALRWHGYSHGTEMSPVESLQG